MERPTVSPYAKPTVGTDACMLIFKCQELNKSWF